MRNQGVLLFCVLGSATLLGIARVGLVAASGEPSGATLTPQQQTVCLLRVYGRTDLGCTWHRPRSGRCLGVRHLHQQRRGNKGQRAAGSSGCHAQRRRQRRGPAAAHQSRETKGGPGTTSQDDIFALLIDAPGNSTAVSTRLTCMHGGHAQVIPLKDLLKDAKPSDFWAEGLAVAFMLYYTINIFLGGRQNKRLAMAWLDEYAGEGRLLQRNFAHVGLGGWTQSQYHPPCGTRRLRCMRVA